MQLKASESSAEKESEEEYGEELEKKSETESGKFSRKAGRGRSRVFPCIGIVLYWGKKRWRQPQSLKALFSDEEWYGKDSVYIDDIRLHVFEMRCLPRDVRSRFRSDMRFVVDYLAEDEENLPRHQSVRHVKELLQLLKAVTGDERYGEIIDSLLQRQEEKGELEMCEILDKYINRGIEQGIEQGIERGLETGRKRGIEQGETLLARLITCLLRDNRSGDVALAASDAGKRQSLYREYGLL